MLEIKFYRTSGEFGEFSNFSKHPIKLDGKLWPTSEHYFQAQKFKNKADRKIVRKANSPILATRIGRDRKLKIRRDWDSVRVEIMRKAVRAKFTQHKELLHLLLSTGDAKLVEHTERDDFWGDGGDGRGRNMLGRILMEVRAELMRNYNKLPQDPGV